MMKGKFTKLLRPGSLVVLMILASLTLQAQWLIYEADVHPSETDGVVAPLLDISVPSESSPAETLIEIVINDPDIVDNKIFKYFHFDAAGKTMYRHDLADESVGTHMTMVARVKGSGSIDPDVRAIDLQWRGAEFRDELRIWPADSILELEKAGVEVKVDMDLNDWHIYRMEIMNDSVAVFVDEDPTEVMTGVSTSTTSSKYVKFGDGSSEPTAGYLDWFILYEDSAANPVANPIPTELTGQGNDVMRNWAYYTADVLPQDNDPVFVESNTGGDPPVNEIMADPDDANNNLLKLVVAGDDSKWMWKLDNGWDMDPAEHVTAIMRVKAVTDTLDRTMELDLHANGLRERLYLKNDGTYELKEIGIKDDGPNMMRWHTVRMTLANGMVNVYMDENPEPFVGGTTETTTSSKYLRFGDGNGSSSLGGYVDYVVWTTDGAFPPDSIPVPLSLKVDEFASWNRNLALLEADAGTLSPAFSPDEDSYTLVVPADTTEVNFTATAADAGAVVSGDLTLDAIPGTATITVTAEDGSTQDYTVAVRNISTDATLSALEVDVGTLDPQFSYDVTAYTLQVHADTTAINITATVADDHATVTGDGEFTNIPGTATITVTAEDGSTLDYTIEVSHITGIDGSQLNRAQIYPNPADHFIMVTLEEAFTGADMNILDAAGRMVRTERYEGGSQRVDLRDLDPGLYILRVVNMGRTAGGSFIIE